MASELDPKTVEYASKFAEYVSTVHAHIPEEHRQNFCVMFGKRVLCSFKTIEEAYTETRFLSQKGIVAAIISPAQKSTEPNPFLTKPYGGKCLVAATGLPAKQSTEPDLPSGDKSFD